MTDEFLSKTFLLEKLNSIKQFISKSEFRYYHIDSIDNFIIHIDKFNSERTSVRMAHQIDEEKVANFRAVLLKYGLELIDDKKAVLISQIKAVIIEMIHYS